MISRAGERVLDLAALKRLILEKTEGNPFFMEEIALSLFEDGTLPRDGDLKLAKAPASLLIPPTIQGILAARIDRLPADEKDVLQMVAVIGTEFSLDVVRAVSAKPDQDVNRTPNDLPRRVRVRTAGRGRYRICFQARGPTM